MYFPLPLDITYSAYPVLPVEVNAYISFISAGEYIDGIGVAILVLRG